MLLIDNLMTAMEDDMRADIYRLQTQFVKQLTQLAKTHNVLILLVSHPRKRILKQFGNDDVAGSSNITNLADVVLNYDTPTEGGNSDRVLQITKNRNSGRLDFDGIPLWFHEGSKRIAEAPQTQAFCWWLGWESAQAEPVDEFIDADEFDDSIPW